MRIAFNTTSLLSPLTGIGQYTWHLGNGLENSAEIDADFFYGAFWKKTVRAEPIPAARTVLPWIRRHVPGSYAMRRLVQAQRFSSHVKRGRFDLYHEPNILPLPFEGPTIVTVHDLSWIRYPETHPPERVRAMNKYFEAGLRQASLLLTDSEFVKQEIVQLFGVSPQKIRAVPLGVEPLFQPRSELETKQTLERHALKYGNYLLAVGTLEPRKNLKSALHAYMRLAPIIRKRYPLVLVGMQGWLTATLESQINPLIAAGEVLRLGYLGRNELACIMAGASALIYPSLYEGFGLPPLEAMACGVPVIVSSASSIPEVVGDGGLHVDPHDVAGLAQAMESVVSDPVLRNKLATAARQRSQYFSWERCVSDTIDAYRYVLDKT